MRFCWCRPSRAARQPGILEHRLSRLCLCPRFTPAFGVNLGYGIFSPLVCMSRSRAVHSESISTILTFRRVASVPRGQAFPGYRPQNGREPEALSKKIRNVRVVRRRFDFRPRAPGSRLPLALTWVKKYSRRATLCLYLPILCRPFGFDFHDSDLS